jgi:hypothetical protein
MLIRRLLTTVATVGTLAVAGLALGPKALARGRAEAPKYEIEADYDGFEVRRYAPRLVAEVTVGGNARQATNDGFRILADFISGNNTVRRKAGTSPLERKAEKIEMTVPVERTASGDKWVIAFTMPSKYTRKTLPVPKDSRIHIRELPARRYAVLRFAGIPSEAMVERLIERFTEIVDDSKLVRSRATPIFARYDPPWTPGIVRRNEIFLELAK